MNCGDPPNVDNAQASYISELQEPLYTAAVRYECEAPYYTLENKGHGEHCLCCTVIFLGLKAQEVLGAGVLCHQVKTGVGL